MADFKAEAERFLALMDAAEPAPRDELFADLAASLSALYATAMTLPDPSPITDMDGPMTHEEWGAVFARVQSLLGKDDSYWTVVPFGGDGADDPDERLVGSLADDLADIYRDLRDGFLLLAAGTPEDDVVWGWRHSFWSHWGEHAVNALRIIHRHLAIDSAGFGPVAG